MKLSYFARTAGKKGGLNQSRREGKIPGILYGKDKTGVPLFVKRDELDALLRKIRPGLLSTVVFELNDGHKTQKALIKEVQYHKTSYAIQHLDFIAVSEQESVTVNVPIQISGISECVGVKLGGFVRHVIRSLKVSCTLKDLPQEFILDVKDLQIAQSLRLSDITLPSGVRPMAKMQEVAVVVAKKA